MSLMDPQLYNRGEGNWCFGGSHLSSLILSFLICKIRITMSPTLERLCED